MISPNYLAEFHLPGHFDSAHALHRLYFHVESAARKMTPNQTPHYRLSLSLSRRLGRTFIILDVFQVKRPNLFSLARSPTDTSFRRLIPSLTATPKHFINDLSGSLYSSFNIFIDQAALCLARSIGFHLLSIHRNTHLKRTTHAQLARGANISEKYCSKIGAERILSN